MAWPKGRSRKVKSGTTPPINTENETIEVEITVAVVEPSYPADWHPGMLLNVRNGGDAYIVTLYPEEADPRKPERTLRFTNTGDAQNFVSHWYSRQSANPLAR